MQGTPLPNCTQEKIVLIAKLVHHVVPASELDAKVEWLIQRQLSDAKNEYPERCMNIDWQAIMPCDAIQERPLAR